jgi:hypothetical protein
MKNESQIIQFTKQFNSPEACYELLSQYKWKDGFKCRRCNCTEAIKGRTVYHRRCKSCYYDESCTAHTLFHKIKFPITKAFAIVFQMATMKKGMSSCEISRQYGITQETAWFFAKKVRLAMNSVLKEQSEHCHCARELSRILKEKPELKLKTANMSKRINKNRGEKQSLHRLKYALCNSIMKSVLSAKKSQNMKKRISAEGILRPERRGKRILNELHLLHPKLETVWPEFRMFNLKSWIIGIHHRITLEHLQGYLAEFAFRYFNRKRIFSLPGQLIQKFAKHCWQPYFTLIAR